MLYIKKLCIKNTIYFRDVCKVLNVSKSTLWNILNNNGRYKLEYLIKFKDYFVSKKILTEDFDVGDFLNEVD